MAWERPQQAEMVCETCPLESCNEQSLWCALSWIRRPNITQSTYRSNYKAARRRTAHKRRLQYFKDRYELRKQNAQT